MIDLFVCTRQN